MLSQGFLNAVRSIRLILLPVMLLLLPQEGGAVVGAGGRDTTSQPPTRLVVKYRPGSVTHEGMRVRGTSATSIDQLARLRDRYRVVEERQFLRNPMVRRLPDHPLRDIFVISVPPDVEIEAVAESYRQLDIVEYAQPDYPLELYEAPDDPLYVHQWSLNNTGQLHYEIERIYGEENDLQVLVAGAVDADIDALEVHEYPPTDLSTVVVAIVDTGVDTDHPDLAGAMWINPNEVPGNGIDDDRNGYVDDVMGCDINEVSGDPTDTYGHGTHCAGIVAAVMSNAIGIAGVCPGARIMAVKAGPITLIDGAEGIVYAAENGADVISMSWGAPFSLQVVHDAVRYARSLGAVVVGSAGNDGRYMVNYPSSYPEVIAVGATTSDDQITWFSTYNNYLDVCAPGLCVLSLRAEGTDMYAYGDEPEVHIVDDNYYLSSGTSMSAPHVAGIAAYLRAVSPGLSHDATRDIIRATADDIVDPYGDGDNLLGWDMYSGYGRVNLYSALSYGAPSVRATLDNSLRGAILSGTVDIHGCADGGDFSEYVLEYCVGDNPDSWVEISSSISPVTDGSLGSWNTGGLSGTFILRLRVGNDNSAYMPVYVANATRAEITSPQAYDTIAGFVSIFGTGICPDFDRVTIEYGSGSSPSVWTEIASHEVPISEDLLCDWNCVNLSYGTHQIRVAVYSSAGLEVTDAVTVTHEMPFAGDNGWRRTLGSDAGLSPTYCDIDLDGAYELIIGTKIGIHVINTDGSLQTTDLPDLPTGDLRITPAVGRLDSDGIDEDIVFVRSDGVMFGFPTGAPPFEVTLSMAPAMGQYMDWDSHMLPRVYLRDINGDGTDEIHYYPGETGIGHTIYNSDGTLWDCGGSAQPFDIRGQRADLDGDGIDEIYCIGDMLREYDLCGSEVMALPIELDGYTMSESRSELSAVDIDADGKVELILTGSYYLGGSNWLPYHIYAFDEGLVLKEGWPHSLRIFGWHRITNPIFGDLDGDGSLEYVCSRGFLDYDYLFVWNLDGTPYVETSGTGEFLRCALSGPPSWPLLVDMDDDLSSDLVVALGPGVHFDPLGETSYESILAYNKLTFRLNHFPLIVSGVIWRPFLHVPIVGDFDQDGYIELAYASSTEDLVYQEFPGVRYRPELAFYPMLHNNRRQNGIVLFEDYSDLDGDGVINSADNCPKIYNPDQADTDSNGIGDACECCVGRVGDVNGIGGDEPTIGDVSSLIDAKFITGSCQGIVACLAEGDINQSGGASPTTDDITIGDISVLIDYLFITGPSLGLPLCR